MAWTAPIEQATGFLVTAAVYNAQIIDNLSYLHGDSGAVIDVSAGGQFLGAAGLLLGVSVQDTRLNRGATGIVEISSTSAGKGNLQLGAIAGSVGAGIVTPDAANFMTRWNATAIGAYTIAAPLNTPPANQTAVIFIVIRNASGGAISLSPNAAYSAFFGAPANGTASYGLFIYNQSTSKWDVLAGATSVPE